MASSGSEQEVNRAAPAWVYRTALSVLTGVVLALLGGLGWLAADKLDDIEKSGEANLQATTTIQLSFAEFRAKYSNFDDRIEALETWRKEHERGRDEKNRKWEAAMVQYEQCKKR